VNTGLITHSFYTILANITDISSCTTFSFISTLSWTLLKTCESHKFVLSSKIYAYSHYQMTNWNDKSVYLCIGSAVLFNGPAGSGPQQQGPQTSYALLFVSRNNNIRICTKKSAYPNWREKNKPTIPSWYKWLHHPSLIPFTWGPISLVARGSISLVAQDPQAR